MLKIIIASTSLNALLKATDGVMEQYGRDEIPERLKGQATLSALKKMFDENRYFDICTVNTIAKMHGTEIPRETEEYFRTLHCVHFKDMTQETREFLFAKCVDLFRGGLVISNLIKPNDKEAD